MSSRDQLYLRMAKVWSENSRATRNKVGALIVKNNMIISDGYNGTPHGFDNRCEDEFDVTLPHVLHAEANAITKVAKSTNSSEGATLYVLLSPCIECAKLIIQAGIERVVYAEDYRLPEGIDLLRKAKVKIDKIEIQKTKTAEAVNNDFYFINTFICLAYNLSWLIIVVEIISKIIKEIEL